MHGVRDAEKPGESSPSFLQSLSRRAIMETSEQAAAMVTQTATMKSSSSNVVKQSFYLFPVSILALVLLVVVSFGGDGDTGTRNGQLIQKQTINQVTTMFNSSYGKTLHQINHPTASSTNTMGSLFNWTAAMKLSSTTNDIRKWGCGLSETPFVFVHIGKSGGGTIRRRIAGSAVNFTRSTKEWSHPEKDESYFPIRRQQRQDHRDYDDNNDANIIKATFCSSGHSKFMPLNQRTFEGTRICTATTPLGQALACPADFHSADDGMCGGDPMDWQSANVVYVGHNDFGTEIHWLPVPYLQNWWDQHWATHSTSSDTANTNNKIVDAISKQWPRLDPNNVWCGNLHRPWLDVTPNQELRFNKCGERINGQVDLAGFEALQQRGVTLLTPMDHARAWSALYSSLPVIRATMMRNPFSWLASKYSWHHLQNRGIRCDDLVYGTAGHIDLYKDVETEKNGQLLMSKSGWMRRFALLQILQLCGSDCRVRHYQKQATLPELQLQAEFNLRQGFAVVGILEDGEDVFFEMLQTRVEYLDLQRNPHLKFHGKHQTPKKGEDGRCKQRFMNPEFQEQILAAAPEVKALVHLYKVADQVNKVQKQELQQCQEETKDALN